MKIIYQWSGYTDCQVHKARKPSNVAGHTHRVRCGCRWEAGRSGRCDSGLLGRKYYKMPSSYYRSNMWMELYSDRTLVAINMGETYIALGGNHPARELIWEMGDKLRLLKRLRTARKWGRKRAEKRLRRLASKIGKMEYM